MYTAPDMAKSSKLNIKIKTTSVFPNRFFIEPFSQLSKPLTKKPLGKFVPVNIAVFPKRDTGRDNGNTSFVSYRLSASFSEKIIRPVSKLPFFLRYRVPFGSVVWIIRSGAERPRVKKKSNKKIKKAGNPTFFIGSFKENKSETKLDSYLL
ncbi:MAG: hypothetical protein IJU53_06925 [Thermoguttaceae bacterium]|nr:hypothetical protein [Thermoguttaceae bacterium]